MSDPTVQWQGYSPVATSDALPYNFTSTPILGDGNAPDTSTPQFQEIVEAVQLLEPSATTEHVAQAWQEYFYGFQPFITEEVYDSEEESLANPDITIDVGAYYKGLFLKKYGEWKEWKQGDGKDLPNNSFPDYLSSVDDSRSRERNVIFWQFLRILDAITLLDSRTINAANRQIMWTEAQKEATQLMASYSIPAIEASDFDVRIPDPDSIRSQSAAMVNIERARQKQKNSQEKANLDETNYSFATDSKAMHMSSLKSFWQTMTKVLGSVINI